MIKRLLLISVITGIFALQLNTTLKAQTVSTFEDLTLATDSFWDGSGTPLGTYFNSGNADFQNYYDTSWGGFWSSGWAYSNIQDSTTSGSANLFGSRPGEGYNASSNYATGQQGAIVNLNASAIGKIVNGFYVTNSTYAAFSMRDGDAFAKKFGGSTGDDPDWFKLTVLAWNGGSQINDSVEFYLADFRSSNNAEDYITSTWEWVDLSSLGNVDSLSFGLTSSDTGAFGMNTPAFFCLDDLTTGDKGVSINELASKESSISVYPNPVADFIIIDASKLDRADFQIRILSNTGSTVYFEHNSGSNSVSIDVKNLPNGAYIVQVISSASNHMSRFIKK